MYKNVKTYLLTYLPIAHMTNSLNFDDNDNLSLLNSDNIVFQPTATLNWNNYTVSVMQ